MLTKGVLLATALAFIGCGLLSFFWPIVIFWDILVMALQMLIQKLKW